MAGTAIRVEGEGLTELQLTRLDLVKMTPEEVLAKDHGGQTRTFTGVALVDILSKAGVKLGTQLRGKNLLKYVVITGADSYQVVLALPEIDPEFTSQAILIAYKVDGEDIAYLLGRISGQQEITVSELRDENVMVLFWPIVGDQLREEVAGELPVPAASDEDNGHPAPTMTPEERLATWEHLAVNMDEWWPSVPRWEQEIKDLFGVTAIRERKRIDVVVRLVEEPSRALEADRLGLEERFHDILAVSIPELVVPVRPGRDMASILEVAARNELLKNAGHHAARELFGVIEKQIRDVPIRGNRAELPASESFRRNDESAMPPPVGSGPKRVR